jgi:magnesium-transporting ATPase (P-type)
VRTGLNTAIGHVMQLTDACRKPETMINLSLKKFSRILTAIILGSSLLDLIISAAKGYDRKYSLKNWAELIMSATPLVGLIAISWCILISAKKMRDMGAAVSNLESVNTMGNTDVVLLEISGTIRFDYLVVRELNYNGKSINAEVNYDSYKTKLEKYEKY